MDTAMRARDGKAPCVLLCVTGGIAAYKSAEVLRLLQKAGCRVKVLMTEHATKFVTPLTFRSLSHEPVAVGTFDDNPGDPIHHISLAQEPDLVLIAPASANVMAKMAHGIADDLMSTTLLAAKSPVLVAPAMNTGMWTAPATQENVATLQRRSVGFVMPDSGYLACGDVGAGKLAPVALIVEAALAALRPKPLAGKHVVVSAGGTQEAIDPVRFISNRSSGTFGYALSRAAYALGARVTLVSAPTALDAPYGVDVVAVESAAQMYDAVDGAFDDADLLICAAAVADYTPVSPADHKLKKAHEHLDRIDLVETKDILAAMSAKKGDRVVIGFAAETDNVIEHAKAKLARKGCDVIIANDVSRADSAFGSATDAVTWITSDACEQIPLAAKSDLAYDILARAYALL